MNRILNLWKNFLLSESKTYFPEKFYLLKDYFSTMKDELTKIEDRYDFENYMLGVFFEKAMDKFNFYNISQGSFRAVLYLDEDFIMKFAITPNGLVHNKQEAIIGRNPKHSRFFTKVYETEKDFFWILSERVKRLDYFNDLPLGWEMQDVLGDLKYSTNSSRSEDIWLLMNWGLAEILKKGSVTKESVKKFTDDVLKKGDAAHNRFLYLFERGLYLKYDPSLKNLANSRLGRVNSFSKEEMDLVYESMTYLFAYYNQAVQDDWFTSQIINLALEIPKLEIWDLRPDNLGIRKNKEVVILDSSLELSSVLG